MKKIVRMTVDNQIVLCRHTLVKELMIDSADKNQRVVTRCPIDSQFQDIAFRLLVHCIHERIRTKDEGHHAE